jgi:hypothetical protein
MAVVPAVKVFYCPSRLLRSVAKATNNINLTLDMGGYFFVAVFAFTAFSHPSNLI